MEYLFIIIILFLVSCNTIHKVEYKLLNDIIKEVVVKEDIYLVCYCEEKILFDDIIKTFKSDRKKLISKIYKNEINRNLNWIFTNKDFKYLTSHYSDREYLNCWEKSKILNNKIQFLTCQDSNDKLQNLFLVTDGNTNKSLSKESQFIMISKPFFDRTRKKAIFFYSNTIIKDETTLKIAIAKIVNNNSEIIGYSYLGID